MGANDESVIWYHKALCVCEQYVYKNWETATSETLVRVVELGNSHERNAMAFEKCGKIWTFATISVKVVLSYPEGRANVHCTVTITALQFSLG